VIVLKKPAANLSLHIILTFEWWYTSFYCIFLLCTQFFKGYGGLFYPESVWGIELASIAIFFWF
jgi:hypothetical protein